MNTVKDEDDHQKSSESEKKDTNKAIVGATKVCRMSYFLFFDTHTFLCIAGRLAWYR